jgi:hypothetical protein
LQGHACVPPAHTHEAPPLDTIASQVPSPTLAALAAPEAISAGEAPANRQLSLVPTSKPKNAPKTDPRSPAEITADAAIAIMRERVEPQLTAMTWTAWRRRNRRFAVDMAQAGMDADAIDAAHQDVSERRGYTMLRLDWLQDALTKASDAIGNDDIQPIVFTAADRAEIQARALQRQAEYEALDQANLRRAELRRAQLHAV